MSLRDRLRPQSRKSEVAAIVEDLKESGQDHEWYPTTLEMIKAVLDDAVGEGDNDESYRWWNRHRDNDFTFLDVGAGDGIFLREAAKRQHRTALLAIEKSDVLIQKLVPFARVIGTDFHQQSFLSKSADLVFCNPPYSEFEHWAQRLIRECPSGRIYLVIPQRWKDSALIQDAIKFREARVATIYSGDFLDADRAARAKVDIIRVISDVNENELFRRFFEARFGDLKGNVEDKDKRQEETKARRAGMVQREGLIPALVKLYELEQIRIQTNYDKAATMDWEVLAELGLSVKSVVDTLKERLSTLKHEYWNELFTCLDAVTKKLTTKNRRSLLETMASFQSADFSTANAYAVLCWVLEHANQYQDKQILDVFDDMLSVANIKNYKSNQKVYDKQGWRYTRSEFSHVALDYRVVLERRGFTESIGKTRYISDGAMSFVMDLLTVANLLGINCPTDHASLTGSGYHNSYWEPGKPLVFNDYAGEVVLEARAFINGNMHVRMSQRFVLGLNVAVGKLRGWLHSSDDAVEEFGPEAATLFEHTYRLGSASYTALTHGIAS